MTVPKPPVGFSSTISNLDVVLVRFLELKSSVQIRRGNKVQHPLLLNLVIQDLNLSHFIVLRYCPQWAPFQALSSLHILDISASARSVSRLPALPAFAAYCGLTSGAILNSATQFRGLWLVVRRCSCPPVNCKPSVGGVFLLVLCLTNFDDFDRCSTPMSRYSPPLKNRARPI